MRPSPEIRRAHPWMRMKGMSSEATFEGGANKSSPCRTKALPLLGIREQHSESVVPSLISKFSRQSLYSKYRGGTEYQIHKHKCTMD